VVLTERILEATSRGRKRAESSREGVWVGELCYLYYTDMGLTSRRLRANYDLEATRVSACPGDGETKPKTVRGHSLVNECFK